MDDSVSSSPSDRIVSHVEKIGEIAERLGDPEAASELEAVREAFVSRMHAIARTASAVIGACTCEELREILEEACRQIVPLDAFFLLAYDPSTHSFHGVGGYDDGEYSAPDSIPAAGTPSERVFEERRSLLTHRAGEPDAQGARITGTGRRSQSSIRSPIISGDQVIGVLTVQSYTPNLYTEEDVEVIEVIASLAASALANIELSAHRRSAEEALRRANDELEQRVEARTAELDLRTAELEQADRRFRSIVEASPSPLLLSRAGDGRILYANDRLERLFEVPEGSLLGKQTPDFYYDANDRPHVVELVRTQGHIRDYPLRVRTATGKMRWVSLSAQRLDFDGEPAIATSLIDITERKETEQALQKSEEHFRRLIENASDLISIIAPDGTTTYQSPALTRLLGYEQEEMIGIHVFDFLCPEDREATAAKFRMMTENPGRSVSAEFRFLHKDGSYRYYEAVGTTLSPKSAEDGVVVNSRDITERRMAEEALRKSEEHFRRLIENSSDVASILDANGVNLYQSPSSERVLGYTSDEMMGTNAFERVHPDDRPTVQKALGAALSKPGTTHVAEFRYRHKDGSWRILEATGRTIDPNDASAGVIVNSRDVTERVEADRELRIQKALLEAQGEASIDGILVVSDEGRILSYNQRFVELWKIPQEVVARRSDDAAVEFVLDQVADPVGFAERVEHLYNHPDEESRDEIALTDGRVFDRYTAPIVGNEGEYYGRIWFFRDMTAEKRRAQELEIARQEAEIAKIQAESANRAKSQFLANMSHELRTPLNAIIGYAEMLVEDAEEAGFQEGVSDLGKIRTAAHHLLGLINDVLDLSKIEAGRMDVYIEEFDVRMLLENVRSTIEPLVEKRQNELRIAVGENLGRMSSDLIKVRQILFNLLSNAAKFTDNGVITLDATRDGEMIVFKVIDTGIGMSQKQIERLFEPFTQADASTTRRYGGTGLGLTISRRFALLLGGSIAVESEEGVGTTFIVSLPALETTSESARSAHGDGAVAAAVAAPSAVTDAAERPLGTAPSESAPLVLVIDDDAPSCDVVQKMLSREGFRVTCAYDGIKGLEKARAERPDVITLDILMPGTSGWEVLARLKADPSTADIPVVIVSVLSDQRLGYALGASEYITKPVERERVITTLKRHLRRSEQEDAPVLLLVEDDASTRDVLQRTFEREGWMVEVADNGRDGIAKLAEGLPAMVVLDLMMPEVDGFAFIEELRARPDWDRIPVVVLTALILSEEDRKRLNGRVQRIIRKGDVRRTEVVSEIRRLLPKEE